MYALRTYFFLRVRVQSSTSGVMAGGPTMHFNNVFSRQIRHMLQTLAEGSSCRSLVEFSSAFSRSLVEFSSKYAGLPSGERLQAFCCDIFVVLWF